MQTGKKQMLETKTKENDNNIQKKCEDGGRFDYKK